MTKRELINALIERTDTDTYKLKRLSKPQLEQQLAAIKEAGDDAAIEKYDLFQMLEQKEEIIEVAKSMEQQNKKDKEISQEVFKTILEKINDDWRKSTLRLRGEINGLIYAKQKLKQEAAQDYIEKNYLKSQLKRAGYLFISITVLLFIMLVYKF